MVNILNYKELNTSNISFDTPIKVKGSYISYAHYTNREGHKLPLIIQTPKLKNINGIVKNDTRCHIELELDKTHWKFYEFITDIDDHNIVIIEKYSSQWFNQKFPIDVVEEFYKTPVKLGRAKSPPKFKLKIPITKGNLSCNIYDDNKQPILYNSIKDGSNILCVMQFIGLRFLKQQVICEWVPIQLKLCEPSSIPIKNYLINEDLLSDRENELIENTEDNVVENTEDNVIENTEEQVIENMEEQVIENMEEPVVANIEEQVIENMEEPVVANIEEQVIENMEEQVIENMEELVIENMEENINEIIDNNVDNLEFINDNLNNLENTIENNKDSELILKLKEELENKNNEINNLKNYLKNIINKLNI